MYFGFPGHDVLGLKRYFIPEDDGFRIVTVQEEDDILERNKAEYNEYSHPQFGTMRKVASVPIALYFELKRRGILDDWNELKKWLNDPDNRFFRTAPGKL